MNNRKFKLSGIGTFIDKALTGWCVFIMALMSLLVILSVILRYVFKLSFVWSEELIILLFITTTYFGAILCVHEDEHIDIRYLRENLSKVPRLILEILICIVNIIVQAALAYISLEWIQKTGSSITVGLKIPYYFIYAMFPIGFISMALYQVRRIINLIRKRKEGREGKELCQ